MKRKKEGSETLGFAATNASRGVLGSIDLSIADTAVFDLHDHNLRVQLCPIKVIPSPRYKILEEETSIIGVYYQRRSMINDPVFCTPIHVPNLIIFPFFPLLLPSFPQPY